MYVDIKVNGKAFRAIVDTGATHYISKIEVKQLVTLEKGCGRVKTINSTAQLVAAIASSVLIKFGLYEVRTNFSVVAMDDFKLILGWALTKIVHGSLLKAYEDELEGSVYRISHEGLWR
ncbi:hypothetical protein RJ640_016208 [Escallonia rubra]|uniref:Uncharacterized protein n=1 Tax=Escallonia rubra TaxID=112253 RepID=A0AA88QV30_9ASTE|nr:hypothetical protein RJ640_016208 [Escallonia rubra]